MKLSTVSKAIAALVTGVLGWAAVVVASPDAAITAPEWLALGVAVATAFGVYGMPNTASAPAEPPAPPVGLPAE